MIKSIFDSIRILCEPLVVLFRIFILILKTIVLMWTIAFLGFFNKFYSFLRTFGSTDDFYLLNKLENKLTLALDDLHDILIGHPHTRNQRNRNDNLVHLEENYLIGVQKINSIKNWKKEGF